MAEYHGHKTLIDGSHIPLTRDEADGLWKMAEDAKAQRAEAMPTAQDALRLLIQAKERLNELGWREGNFCIRANDECAVAQTGSTGMWKGWLDDERKYVHHGDSVNSPRDVWLKPMTDLSDDERRHMDECDKREAEAYAAAVVRYAAMGEDGK